MKGSQQGMILHDLTGNEEHPAHRKMEIENGNRHHGFPGSSVEAALAADRPFLSQTVLKAVNHHAIVCLHPYAGEYRPCEVSVGDFCPPQHFRVQSLMDDLVNWVKRHWESNDPVALASFVLWRINHMHPFINGNGRTARAACHFVLCLKAGGWLPGRTMVPEMLRDADSHQVHVKALREVDEAFAAGSSDFLKPVVELLNKFLHEQLKAGMGGSAAPSGQQG